MKRHMDLLREIAFAVESNEDLEVLIDSKTLAFEGYSPEQISYHVRLMVDSGLLVTLGGPRYEGKMCPYFTIERLTVSGHDFVEAARSDKVWETVKRNVSETVGSVSFSVLVELLKQAGLKMAGLA